MSTRVTVHVNNDDPFVADMEELPEASASFVYVTNPRTREGRPVAWNSGSTKGFIFPLWRITYIEVMVTDDDIDAVKAFYKDQLRG